MEEIRRIPQQITAAADPSWVQMEAAQFSLKDAYSWEALLIVIIKNSDVSASNVLTRLSVVPREADEQHH